MAGTTRISIGDADLSSANTLPVGGAGTAGTATGGVLTVQGVASMTPILATVTGAVTAAAATTGGYSFLNIVAGTATTVVKASAGTLHSITLNGSGLATNVTTVYDHASGAGTVIAIISGALATVPSTLLFDVACAAGITVITTVANGGNMTVCYK